MTADTPESDARPAAPALDERIERITRSILGDRRLHHLSGAALPERRSVISIVEKLSELMFPGFIGLRDLTPETVRDHCRELVNEISVGLVHQITGALHYAETRVNGDCDGPHGLADCEAMAKQMTLDFLAAVPGIRDLLSLDVQAAYDGDPAARHTDETIFCYPGVRALMMHRIAHQLERQGVPLLPRIINEFAHSRTGIDIHPGARIGRSFFIDHGTGVVIGETTVIGDHCKIYQGVTLGAKSFPTDERGRLKRGVRRHPTLEDYVTVYAGATILGGDTVIGAGSIINGGVFLTSSVPPNHTVRAPRTELSLRSNPEMPPGNYAI
jgi:serine O-acetyltransferase